MPTDDISRPEPGDALSDTDAATRARLLQCYRELSKEQRLARALALSGLVRGLIWRRLRDRHPTLDTAELAGRFLRQVYGAALAAWVLPRLSSVAQR